MDVVRSDRSRDEADHTFQDVDLGRGQATALDAFPLLPDVEVLIDPNVIEKLDLVLEVEGTLVKLVPNNVVRELLALEHVKIVIFHQLSPSL